MDVSIIIVNYNTSRLIADCVRSIIRLTKDIWYEVIIVDNNSEPDFQTIISEEIPSSMASGFQFVPLPENIGFGRANNEGLKFASGRNILFLNPDTILLNNAIKILSDFLDRNRGAGACGGNLFDENMHPSYSFKRFLPGIFWETDDLLNTLPQNLIYRPNKFFNNGDLPIKVGFITGADLMVKKSVIEKTGAFRDEFFMYFEETDLCYRIRKLGWEIYCVPQAEIQHLESKSFGESQSFQSEFKTKYFELSRNLYYSLNAGRVKRFFVNSIYTVFLNSRILFLKNRKKKEYYRLRLKYFKS